ncbi:autoinducer binding domain-containing protein [Pseudomonas putida]|uniref:autoinducer binding domain-containing protein n=1 Tax=Pseudomonas putida TaxID=303 RepID=UPI002367345A|nr:autoinducer binding domain-containing protein [Pseudomonas putida]MDD2045982.1 autoinducer binding domain-containing protein [Pseudomonas putida]
MNNRTSVQQQCLLDLPHLLERLPLHIKKLGFHFFAFTYISPSRCDNTSNYPESWFKHYDRQGYAARDPVPVYCKRSSVPLLWSLATYNDTPDIWALAQACGLCHGWVQPIHGEQAQSSLSILRPDTSVSTQELYQKAAQVMWLGEQLHRASIEFFAQQHPNRNPGAPKLFGVIPKDEG